MGLPKRNRASDILRPVKPALLPALFLVLVSCRQPETVEPAAETVSPVDAQAHRSDVESWKKTRDTRLRAEDGWLTLVGLTWLKDGKNTLNTPLEGTFTLQNGKVMLQPNAKFAIDGKPVTKPVELKDDVDPNGPTVVTSGSMRFNIIKRSDRYGVRIKDAESAARKNFKGMEYFPIAPRWRFEAKLEPHTPEKKIPITNIVGQTTDEVSPGALVFMIDGKTHRLDPILEQGSTDYFVIFKDETSRDATYPAGRYLYASPAGPDGKVILDFNKAYNPPCVFTPFATCPLPPLQNKLPLRIEAGEKNYKHSAT